MTYEFNNQDQQEVEQPDLYMHVASCGGLDDIMDEITHWSNNNKDKVFKSHSLCVVGMQYLLTIVYAYVECD